MYGRRTASHVYFSVLHSELFRFPHLLAVLLEPPGLELIYHLPNIVIMLRIV